ncbi:MAG: cellulase family glycosylhydrolase [Oscillospiraceae bacterium]|nr:cellulase family glycosylhydrolase [Oscillospiraceae bacterium]
MKQGILKRLAAVALSGAMLFGMTTAVAPEKVAAAPDEYHDDWLHVENGKVVDMDGNEVWMTGVNWFGYNVGSQIFDGAWSANVHDCLKLISDHGFNLLRVPMSTEILLQWKSGGKDPIIKLNEYKNPELTLEGVEGGTPMYSFDIWNQVVAWCREEGIKIMMDVHCATTNAAGHNYALWYDPNYSEEDWLEALAWFADYYKDDDTIIAIDLKNEPHGKKDDGIFAKWDGSSDANNWRYSAEKGAKACLDQNPNLLIMVEGIEVYPKFEKGFDWNSPSTDYAHYGDPDYEPFYGAWWGANFRGVRDYPVNLGDRQSQLVYSPHDYGPMVWEQTWFHLEGKKPNYTSYDFDEESMLKEYWYDTWAYLVEENMYPLLMGEWGGWTDDEHDPSGANRHWMTVLRDYMIKKHIHHTFWCFNENSSDTGGLMYDNFQKWDDVKYEFVKPALWQDANGKFISLDHKIPLGKNGITVAEYYGNPQPRPTEPTEATEPTEKPTEATEATEATVATDKPEPSETHPEPTPTSNPEVTLYGDVDESGKVDILDVITLNKSLMVGEKLTMYGKANADVDRSGKVDETDSLNILKSVVEIITLPVA